MFSLLTKIFGTANDRIVKKYRREVEIINRYEEAISKLTDEELKAKTAKFKEDVAAGTPLEDIKHEAFAISKEAAFRAIGLKPFDEQLIGGLVLHDGNITEMRTGEGKTLVATLPAYLNALTGRGVHIVTVNDYLAKRDAEWMGRIFKLLGLSVGYIVSNMPDQLRKEAYQADILYATNNELGFDFLRDNMKFTKESKTQRTFNYAIIDEVDSILIDEARTPLIISGPVDVNLKQHEKVDILIRQLKQEHYEIDEKSKSVTLTDEGINVMELMLAEADLIKTHTSLYDFENLSLVHFINQGLRAHFVFSKDVDYLVKDNKVMIIDEFTGRIMDGRRYSDGLHQALEAKEHVPIQNENQTLASITFQNYFRNYPKLSGMTGTAMTEAAEFKDIYNLEVVSVPTHNKVTRIDYEDEIYGTIKEKNDAVFKQIISCYEKGQPVLVGTISIEKSEEISRYLTAKKIPHNVLNAKMHEQEAYIIAQAGRYKAVTIATNMAGRGTDIQLGGNAEMMISHLELDSKSQEQIDLAIKRVHESVKEEKEKVIKAGGMYVIGTERHESRRIDNQLRGRSGRQGDPGETKFFLSLEDDLMRIFASERLSAILKTLGLKNGEAIQSSMVSKSIEKAQKKVESHNYEVRKNVLRFDDVMNDQRKIIYQQRNEIIESNDVKEFRESLTHQVVDDVIKKYIKSESYREDWDLEGLSSEILRQFGIRISKDEINSIEGAEEQIISNLLARIQEIYKQKEQDYTEEIFGEADKAILLATLDHVWKEHLHNLDHLRQGISLRAYGQKNPLTEYKREAFQLFEVMLDHLKTLYVQRLCYLHIDMEHLNRQSINLSNQQLQEMHTSRSDPAFENNQSDSVRKSGKSTPFKAFVEAKDRDPSDPSTWGKISRNELCPCESGKKYKHCHGADDSN